MKERGSHSTCTPAPSQTKAEQSATATDQAGQSGICQNKVRATIVALPIRKPPAIACTVWPRACLLITVSDLGWMCVMIKDMMLLLMFSGPCFATGV
jgi:hypothetical protein